MDTFRISRDRAGLVAIGLVSFTLTACGSHGSGTSADANTTPTGDAPSQSTTLDCARDNYPCSFAEVPLPVIERSLALSDEVAQRLGNGAAIDQVATFLSSQSDMAEVTIDGPVLGFRLAGGRPMIVDVTGDQRMLPSPTPASPTSVPSSVPDISGKLRSVRTVMSSKITGDNKAPRRALVLSPFQYEDEFGSAGVEIAAAINGVRGYAGNVTYLATTNESEPRVTVDTLTQLEDYDVIHIDTHGGTLCKKDGGGVNAEKAKCADGLTDFLVQRFHGTAQDLQSITHPGVIHYRGQLHQSIAVTADFFRHYYPQGLADKLFILAACNTFRTDMAEAIAGDRGVLVAWDGYIDFTLVKNTGLSLLDSLGLGLTVGEAFARIPPFSPGNPKAQGSVQRRPRQVGGDLRIRDLITVRDNLTGEPISDASGIEVMELPEDGRNDNLNLEFTVDGITPEQLANFRINLVIDNMTLGQIDLGTSGVPVGDFSYRVSTPVPLPFDVEELQALHMDFWIPLPDQGQDHFIAAPRVNDGLEPEVGRRWALGSRLSESHHDSSTTITAEVEFELDPQDNPSSNFHTFYVSSGHVRVQRDYQDAQNCSYHIDHTIDLPANASNNYVTFEATASHMVVNGFGRIPNESIQVISSCGSTATVNLGGVYFLAEDTIVTGNSAQGTYNDGANNPTVIDWTLDKIE